MRNDLDKWEWAIIWTPIEWSNQVGRCTRGGGQGPGGEETGDRTGGGPRDGTRGGSVISGMYILGGLYNDISVGWR